MKKTMKYNHFQKRINELSENEQIELIKQNIKNFYEINNPSNKVTKAAIDKDPDIYANLKITFNEELTTYCYYAILENLRNNKHYSKVNMIKNLIMYGHEVSDEIRIHAVKNDKILIPNLTLKYIAPLEENDYPDLRKINRGVIDAIIDTLLNRYREVFKTDQELAQELISLSFDLNMITHNDDTYTEKVFSFLCDNTISLVGKNELIDCVKNGTSRQMKNIIARFNK